MRYLFTVVIIVISWAAIIALMSLVDEQQHLLLYVLAVLNTLVLYLIGFRGN